MPLTEHVDLGPFASQALGPRGPLGDPDRPPALERLEMAQQDVEVPAAGAGQVDDRQLVAAAWSACGFHRRCDGSRRAQGRAAESARRGRSAARI
jgi:hypothetical protein